MIWLRRVMQVDPFTLSLSKGERRCSCFDKPVLSDVRPSTELRTNGFARVVWLVWLFGCFPAVFAEEISTLPKEAEENGRRIGVQHAEAFRVLRLE